MIKLIVLIKMLVGLNVDDSGASANHSLDADPADSRACIRA